MVIAVLAAMLLLVPLLLIFFRFIERRQERTDGHRTTIDRDKDISRGEFVLTILIAFMLTALVLIVSMTVTQGVNGLIGGAIFSTYSIVFAAPVLLTAVIVGYPTYQVCSKVAAGFPGIWIGYSIAALVSALLAALVIASFGSESFGVALFPLLVAPSVVLAIPSSIIAWYRNKNRAR